MKMLSIIILGLLLITTAFADELDMPSALDMSGKDYASGPLRLQFVKQADAVQSPEAAYVLKSLTGQTGFVDVPLNYEDPNSRTTKVFYRLPTPIDEKKQTLLFFNGGPGGTSFQNQFHKVFPDFNLIYVDQRGTGFSALPTFSDQINAKNFSSELIARDAEKLLNHLNLKKVSVWGHSYGTVVGTIFASLFPDRVTALVLEGVIYTGTPEIWTSPHRVKILQKYFDALPQDLKSKILSWSDGKKAPKNWFSAMAQAAMYGDNSLKSMTEKFENIFRQPDFIITGMLSREATDKTLYSESLFFSTFMFHQIACQELSRGDAGGSFSAHFENGKLVPSPNPDPETCLLLPEMKDRMKRTYLATKYPLMVPVTYLQGTTDGATEAPNAIRHYKNVAKGKAQLLIAKNHGHSPLKGCLKPVENPKEEIECKHLAEAYKTMKKALLGEEVLKADVKALGKEWTFTNKGWNK